MKQIVLRSPVVLYETVEALYQHVNGLSVEGRKRDLLQKFGSKLTRTEREQIEQSCALAAKVAEAACAETDTLHNMPFEVTPESVYAAILTADALGRRYAEL